MTSASRNSIDGGPTARPGRGLPLGTLVLAVSVLDAMGGFVIQHTIGGPVHDRRAVRAKTDISNFSQACDMFKIDMGYYPQGIEDLVSAPGDATNWDGPYLKEPRVPVDPWGNEYDYALDPRGYTIRSWGSDGRRGGRGEARDIASDDGAAW